jgi:hypothetical protein
VPRRRTLFHYSADVRLFIGIAFARHTGTAVAAKLTVPWLVRMVLTDPPDAVTDWAIRICHQLTRYFRDSPLNELARKRPSEVMSRYSISATKVGSTHVAFGFLTGLVSLDFWTSGSPPY